MRTSLKHECARGKIFILEYDSTLARLTECFINLVSIPL